MRSAGCVVYMSGNVRNTGGNAAEVDMRHLRGPAPLLICALALLTLSVPDLRATDSAVLDEAVEAILLEMGVMPFARRVPSENFTLPGLSGQLQSLNEWRGKVVFLNFWATWCPPCREEMPAMQDLYDELGDAGLVVVAVNVLERAETARAFIEEFGYTYPVVLDRDGRTAMRYAVRAYPTTYVIDREGYVIGVRPGYHEWNAPEVIEAFRSLLTSGTPVR